MSFAFPVFLWALSALAIPIIIHLFSFRRTTRIFFSNTRLLKQVKQETTQKRKLKQYLVLASRLLFIFFLVMAFAQPFLPAAEQITPGREVTLYIDNSYSMVSLIGEKTRALDAGLNFAREIVSLFPPDTRYKLLTNDFAPFSNTYKTRSELLDLLTQIRLSPIARTFSEINNRAASNRNELFWISDFQKSTLGDIKSLEYDSLQSWHLVSIPLEGASNVLIDSVYLEDPFVVGGERNTLHVTLRNIGLKLREGLVTKLAINGVQMGTASVNLEPNSTASVKFDLVQGLKGLNRAVISFTDFPVSFDNEFYVTLNFSERIRIVEVTTGSTYIEKVFGNSSLFSYRRFHTGNIDVGMLYQADLVILNAVENLDVALLNILREYQNGPGILLIVPPAKGEWTQYKRLTTGFSVVKKETKEWLELDKPDFHNPFFENVFEEHSASMAMPKSKPVIAWGNDRSAILRYKDGAPFLSRSGNTILMAAPLESGFSDFQSHALFVPVMYRMAASGHRISQKPYYLLSESTITLHTDSLVGEAPVRLIGKQEIVPTQRRSVDQVVLEIPRFSIDPGFYQAQVQQDTVGLIAFDLDKRESLLEQWTGDEVKAMLGGGNNISVFIPGAPGSFSNEIKERYLGNQLWKYALMAALLFLLAEVVLIRFLK